MRQSFEFIVLAATKVGDSSMVLHTLSPEFGRRSFICSVGKSTPTALFQPLNILSGVYTENTKSDLWRIGSLKAEYPLLGIRTSVGKNAMTMFLGEVLFRALRDGANEEGLYEWLRGSLLTLDALGSDWANFHLRFLLELCGALGFSPSMEDLAPFVGERYHQVQDLLSSSYEKCLLLPLSGDGRNEIAGLLLDYLGFHLEMNLNIRSLRVLRELFG